ncbi:MAG: hypothetical protein IJW45_03620 [Oscillospiraceae bacterium]|nr:hypothetical protein [Oscillospiraceae bacterium]
MERLVSLLLVALLLAGCSAEEGPGEQTSPQTTAPMATTQPQGDVLRLDEYQVITQAQGQTHTVMKSFGYEEDVLRRVTESYDGTKTKETLYDSAGQIQSQTQWDSAGRVVSRWDYEYDHRGQLTQEVCRADDQERSRTTYGYDDAGRMVEKTFFQEGAEQTRQTWAYDELGQVLEVVQYELGQEVDRVVYAYAGQGMIRDYVHFRQGQELERCDYTYGPAGEQLEARYSYQGKESSLTTFTYDESGAQTAEICRYPDGSGYERHFRTTQTDGLIVREETLEQNGQLIFHGLYTYGSDGALLEQVETGSGSVTRIVFSYDDGGREISRTTYEDDRQTQRLEYDYDVSGQLVGERSYQDEALEWAYTYSYLDGHLIGGEKVSGDGQTTVILRATTRRVAADDVQAQMLAQLFGQLEEIL